MTDQPRFPTNHQRDSLRARIDAAERRNAERSLADNARAAASTAVDYTRANPLKVIGGALAVGVVIGLLTRPGRQAARKVVGSATGAVTGAVTDAAASAGSGVKTIAARGGTAIGTMLGEAAVAYLMTLIDEAVETARAGQERAEELGDAAGVRARKLRDDASEAAGSAAGSTKALARKTRTAAAGLVRDLARKTKR